MLISDKLIYVIVLLKKPQSYNNDVSLYIQFLILHDLSTTKGIIYNPISRNTKS